jgi:ferric-dicitrate binding protein FerR (iron transport regulator)
MRRLLSLLIITSLALAQEVGRVEDFSGKVDKLRRGEVRPQPLRAEIAGLSVGDIIRTRSDGRAKVSFIDGNKAELGPFTRLDVIDYQKTRSVSLTRGRVLFEVVKLAPGEGFEVKTPTAILGVKGTTFLVDVSPVATVVSVISGAVQIIPVANPSLSVLATPGTTYTATSTEVRRADIPPPAERSPSVEPTRPPTPEVTPPCVR